MIKLNHKKYLEVFRWSFKMQIVWRFDVAMTMLATIVRILTAWVLWGAIFAHPAGTVQPAGMAYNEYIGVFNFQAMLSYYIVSSILISLDFSNKISDEIMWLIKDGGFSKHMVTPMNPFSFFSCMAAGESAFHLWFSYAAAFLCSLLFGVSVVFSADFLAVAAALIMIPLGLFFMMCFHYFLGILSFRFLNIRAVIYVSNNLTAFLTGALVPLALLPDALLNVMKLFPFYYVTYLPAMLLTGNCGASEALSGIAILACWVSAFLALNHFTYNRLRTSYEGVGI